MGYVNSKGVYISDAPVGASSQFQSSSTGSAASSANSRSNTTTPDNTTISGSSITGTSVPQGQTAVTVPSTTPQIGSPSLQGAPVQNQTPVAPPKSSTVTPGSPEAAKVQQVADMQKYFPQIHSSLTAGGASPDSGGAARTAIDKESNSIAGSQPVSAVDTSGVAPQTDPYIDLLMQERKDYASTQSTSLVDDYNTISSQLGLPAINTALMNIKNVMAGTEDDVRTEITKAGGFATESQVQGLVYARNKGLVKQAQFLQDQKDSAQGQLDTLVGLDEKQKSLAQTRFDTMLNLDTKIADHEQLVHQNAVDQYNKTVDEIGYNGLALGASPSQKRNIESALGKPAGFLDNPPLTAKQVSEQLAQNRFVVSEKNADRRLSIQLASANRASDMAAAREISLYSGIVNKTVSSLYPSGKSPIQTYNNSKQSINRLDVAYKLASDPNNTNKAAPDLDLVDSYISIAKGGQQQITEGQVDVLLSGLGVKAKWDVATQKITGTGILDNGTRKSIYDATHGIFDGQKTLADEGVQTINGRLQQEGVPDTMWFTSADQVDTTAGVDNTNLPADTTTVMKDSSGTSHVYKSDGNGGWVLNE